MTAALKDRSSKAELRKLFLEKRRDIDPLSRRQADAQIVDHLRTMNELSTSSMIAAFVSDGSEPDISAYLAERLKDGARVLLPRYREESDGGDENIYEMVEITDFHADTRPGKYGIFEPEKHLAAIGTDSFGDLSWLVPGVAFSRDGKRLGRGKGVYDRLLRHGGKIFTGICYECQICADLPEDGHDRRVDAIVTEKGVYNAR